MVEGLVLIGFGEAGETFASAGRWKAGVNVIDVAAERRAAAQAVGIGAGTSPGEALDGARLVISLVTADQALAAALAYAPHLPADAIWCDMNSVAPNTKREAGRAVEAAGATYVDGAILAPVKPAALGVPLLLAGQAADRAGTLLTQAGFSDVRVVGDEIGRASSIKMVRSVMVKGLEALTAEMMVAAERAGVADEVLASLDASETRVGWRERAEYQLERMSRHGLRRAAEMEESAKTLEGLGVEPIMTRGTIRWQRQMAGKEFA